MSTQPKRIDAFDAGSISMPVDELLLIKLRIAADACLVQRSLSPTIACGVRLRSVSGQRFA